MKSRSNNLKTKYEYFLETLNMAYCAGLDLYDEMKEIHDTNKNDYNMEWQLFYLKLYLEQIDDIIENITNNICIKEPVKKEEENKNNLLILPLYPDEDVFVDKDFNLRDLWRKLT